MPDPRAVQGAPSIEERVQALEDYKITVEDLPIAALIRKIERLGMDTADFDSLVGVLRSTDGGFNQIYVGSTPAIGLATGGLTTQTVTLPKALSSYRVFPSVVDGGNASMVTHSVVYNSLSQFTLWLKNNNSVTASFAMTWVVLGLAQ